MPIHAVVQRAHDIAALRYLFERPLLVPGRGRIGPTTSKTLITQNYLIGTS